MLRNMFKKKESKRNDIVKAQVSDSRLVINCRGCRGPASISDRGCLLCVCRYIEGQGNISSITLRSAVDVSIDGDAVSSIRELAFIYRLMSMNRSERKGKKCARCKRSFTALVRDQLTFFPDVSIPLLRDRMTQMQFPDPVCALCASDSINLINTIGSALDDIATSNSPFEQEVE